MEAKDTATLRSEHPMAGPRVRGAVRELMGGEACGSQLCPLKTGVVWARGRLQMPLGGELSTPPEPGPGAGSAWLLLLPGLACGRRPPHRTHSEGLMAGAC